MFSQPVESIGAASHDAERGCVDWPEKGKTSSSVGKPFPICKDDAVQLKLKLYGVFTESELTSWSIVESSEFLFDF